MTKLLGAVTATLLLVAAPAAATVAHRREASPAPSGPAAAAPRARVTSASLGGAPALLDGYLGDQLRTAAAGAALGVFVHADDIETAEAAVAAAGLRPVGEFRRVGVAYAVGTPAQILKARVAPGVTYLEGNRALDLTLDTSHIATRGEEARTAFQRIPAPSSTTTTTKKGKACAAKTSTKRCAPAPAAPFTPAFAPEIDGRGVSVAVVDSGVDGTHPFFQQDGASKVVRNLKLACHDLLCEDGSTVPTDVGFVDVTAVNDTDTPSLGGHGTHVAGIAAGVDVTTTDSPAKHLHGGAPGAKIVSLSVGVTLSVYGGDSGLNWILEHHAQPCGPDADAAACPPIRVVNNSYGPPGGGEYDPNSVTAKLQDALVAEGVVVVWAAGNDGGDGGSNLSNPPGQSPTPGVLMVANYDDGGTGNRDNTLDSSSSRAQEGRPDTYPDLSAPGANIESSCRPYLPICSTGLDGGDPDYDTISGTSMATPHIAGIVAQLLEVKPSLTPGEIEDVLEDTAHKFGTGYETDPRNPDSTTSFDKGHGLVDVVAAVARVLGVDAPAAKAACAPDSPVVVDAPGDATRVIEPTPLPSEPSLDVVEGRLAWDATKTTTTFSIRVADLAEEDPQGTTGVAFDFNFTYDGKSYYLLATRQTGEASFELGQLETTGRAAVAEGLTGSFDAEHDLITIELANADLQGTDVKPFAAGDTLGGFEIVSRRDLGAIIPDADSAGGQCPYTLGLGAVPGAPTAGGGTDPGTDPGTTPAGPVEGTVSPGGSYAWSGAARTDAAVGNNVLGLMELSPVGVDTGLQECDLTVSGSCEEHVVQLNVPSTGADVTITLTPTSPGAVDLDVLLLDPAGRIIAEAATESAAETLTAHLTKAGAYTVRLRHYVAVEATYDGLLTLA